MPHAFMRVEDQYTAALVRDGLVRDGTGIRTLMPTPSFQAMGSSLALSDLVTTRRGLLAVLRILATGASIVISRLDIVLAMLRGAVVSDSLDTRSTSAEEALEVSTVAELWERALAVAEGSEVAGPAASTVAPQAVSMAAGAAVFMEVVEDTVKANGPSLTADAGLV